MTYTIYNPDTGETIMSENPRALFQAARMVARIDAWPLPICIKRDKKPIAVYTTTGFQWLKN